jgi:hypothetical protein
VKFKYQKTLKLTKEEMCALRNAADDALASVVKTLFDERNARALCMKKRIHPILFRRTLREQCGWNETKMTEDRLLELCPYWDDERATPITPPDSGSGSGSGGVSRRGSGDESSDNGGGSGSGDGSGSGGGGDTNNESGVSGGCGGVSGRGSGDESGVNGGGSGDESGDSVGSDDGNDGGSDGGGGSDSDSVSNDDDDDDDDDEIIPLKKRLLDNFNNFILPILETETMDKNYHTLLSSKKAPGQIDVEKSKQWKCRVCNTNTTTWCVQCSIIYDLSYQARVITPVHEKCLAEHKLIFKKRMIKMEKEKM